MLRSLILGLLLALTPNLARATDVAPLQAIPKLDLNRYLGRWYEIASFPQRFQKGCVATTATYSIRPDGDIRVENECRIDRLDGPTKRSEGKAWVVDKVSNAKLEVQFFWPFHGSYWVIELGQDYEYAVVSHPNREYLWILSRTPKMDRTKYDGILNRLQAVGLDISKLNVTPQNP